MATTKSLLEQVLSDVEKAKIAQFVEDDVMKEAVKKVLLFGKTHNGTARKGEAVNATLNFAFYKVSNGDLSNEQLGEDLRAKWEAINILENGFTQLEGFKKQVVPENIKKNVAR